MSSIEAASAGVAKLASSATSETWERAHPRGKLQLHWSATGAVRMRVVGRGAAAFAPIIIERYRLAAHEAGSVVILFDLAKMPNYDTELRQQLTDWCLANRASIASMHLYAESSVVLMGARVASLLLRGLLQIHTHRDAFDSVVRSNGLTPPTGA